MPTLVIYPLSKKGYLFSSFSLKEKALVLLAFRSRQGKGQEGKTPYQKRVVF